MDTFAAVVLVLIVTLLVLVAGAAALFVKKERQVKDDVILPSHLISAIIIIADGLRSLVGLPHDQLLTPLTKNRVTRRPTPHNRRTKSGIQQ